jgi:hypothetical protein
MRVCSPAGASTTAGDSVQEEPGKSPLHVPGNLGEVVTQAGCHSSDVQRGNSSSLNNASQVGQLVLLGAAMPPWWLWHASGKLVRAGPITSTVSTGVSDCTGVCPL